ncbi:hypothetical protein BKA81DRAFT_364976 [Phyllosticta paracitricarpa]
MTQRSAERREEKDGWTDDCDGGMWDRLTERVAHAMRCVLYCLGGCAISWTHVRMSSHMFLPSPASFSVCLFIRQKSSRQPMCAVLQQQQQQ